ncbi:MAG TPA: ABC transporter transmembrane domain-containing protein, partial [Burkholderiales bacterium]|nr:ABC transporter transmembrane domain-containing protein [Burkholderiales bacterium]
MLTLKSIVGFLEPKHRRQALFTIAVMIGISLLEIAGIGAIFPLMAVLSDPGRISTVPIVSDVYAWLQPTDVTNFVMLMAVAIVGLFLLKAIAVGLSYRWQFRFAYDVQRTLMTKLLRAYLLAPYRFYLDKNTADLLKNVQSEVPAMANGALIPSLQIVGEVIVLFAILVLLVVVDPLLTAAIILIIGALVPTVLWLTKHRTEKYAAQRRVMIGEMYKTASAALGGFKDLKVLGRQQHFLDEYENAARKYCESNAYIMLMGQIPRLVLELVLFLGIVSVLVYAAYWTGDVRNALPLLALYGVAAARSLPSLNKIIAGAIQIRYYRGL